MNPIIVTCSGKVVSESYPLRSPQTKNGTIFLFSPDKWDVSYEEKSRNDVKDFGLNSIGGL